MHTASCTATILRWRCLQAKHTDGLHRPHEEGLTVPCTTYQSMLVQSSRTRGRKMPAAWEQGA